MEGISSVVKFNETGGKDTPYEKFRETMTNEVNAAVEGVVAAGADLIDVVDWHGGAVNILHEKIHPRANLIRGLNQPPLMSFVKEKSYDAAIILGIHSRHGTGRGVISHTMNGITETGINGEMVGEVQLIAAFCGHFSIPTVKKIDETTVEFECENIVEYYKMLTAITLVASLIYNRLMK